MQLDLQVCVCGGGGGECASCVRWGGEGGGWLRCAQCRMAGIFAPCSASSCAPRPLPLLDANRGRRCAAARCCPQPRGHAHMRRPAPCQHHVSVDRGRCGAAAAHSHTALGRPAAHANHPPTPPPQPPAPRPPQDLQQAREQAVGVDRRAQRACDRDRDAAVHQRGDHPARARREHDHVRQHGGRGRGVGGGVSCVFCDEAFCLRMGARELDPEFARPMRSQPTRAPTTRAPTTCPPPGAHLRNARGEPLLPHPQLRAVARARLDGAQVRGRGRLGEKAGGGAGVGGGGLARSTGWRAGGGGGWGGG